MKYINAKHYSGIIPGQGRKRALLIGINYFGTDAELGGKLRIPWT